MVPRDVIDLLSTDDEAQPQAPNINNFQAPSSYLLLDDEFNSTKSSRGSTKRRKLSPLVSSNDEDCAASRLPGPGSRRVLANSLPQRKAQLTDTWMPIDGSNPIVFTSSVGVRDADSTTHGIGHSPSFSDNSDDSLPNDVISAPKRESRTVPALSGRTSTLLASLSRSPKSAKPSNPRKRSKDKDVSQNKDDLQRAKDEEDTSGHECGTSKLKKSLKSLKGSQSIQEEKIAKETTRVRERAEKDREKEQAKVARKEQKAKEKEEELERKRILKEEKAREKRIAADLAQVNKSKLDRKDSTPEMIVDLPASFDGHSLDTQIREFLKDLGVDITLYQSPIPNVVRWRRKMKARWSAELEHWEPLERLEIHEEKYVMCIISAKEYVALAMAQNNHENIEKHIAGLKRAYDGCTPIYLIEGLHAYMRKNKTAENRAYQEKVNLLNQSNMDGVSSANHKTSRTKKTAQMIVDEDLIEDTLLRLQITNGSIVHHTNTTVETAEWVAHFTEHVSTIPYKYCLCFYSFRTAY